MISRDTREGLWNKIIIENCIKLFGEHSFCIGDVSAKNSSLLLSCQESLYI